MPRPLPRISKSLPKRKPRVREGNSAAYLLLVRLLPCLLCPQENRDAIEAHHVRLGDEPDHGMGLKPKDKMAVPLCKWKHHVPGIHAHGNDEVYLMQHGFDARALTSALWAERGDLMKMERVVFRFRQLAEQKRRAA